MALPESGPAHPLAGIRVLELGQVISGPYAGLLLADLGAEVIKVEAPPDGDSARNPEVTPLRGHSATFMTFNRNKRSVCLDLKSDAGYAAFADLVRTSDVVVSNLTPRVARALRVDRESLAALNARIVSCAIQGYRSHWAQTDEPSFDLVHQALTGYMLMEGRPGDPPLRVSIPLADLTAAMFAVQGVLAALVARDGSGRGDHVEVPMYDSLLSLLTYTATIYLNSGKLPERMGSAHDYTVPWQAVPTKDGDIVVAVRSHRFWARLCEALGRPEWLTDERFSSNAARLAHRAEMDRVLEEALATLTRTEALRLLREHGVPVAPVRDVGEALDATMAIDPDFVQVFDDPELGPVRVVGSPIRFERMTTVTPSAAPELDEYASTPTTGESA